MTPEELREVAVAQNDRDHAAGLLPSRYIEDPSVLDQVARLLADVDGHDDGHGGGGGRPPAASTPTARARAARKAASS